jgi:hypothetical protein
LGSRDRRLRTLRVPAGSVAVSALRLRHSLRRKDWWFEVAMTWKLASSSWVRMAWAGENFGLRGCGLS